MKQTILTGIRSNEEPTLGNYIGAMVPTVRLQHEKSDNYRINMFVPDLHSFTTPINHNELYEKTLKNIKYFVAAGIDLTNKDSYLYRQSYISAHSELTWILDCFTGFGEMSRMTQFKDKSSSKDNVTVGLFNYPVLMAADILLYGAAWVPVGDDQRQHLEITRDIAERMNNKFGELFTVPASWQEQLEFTQLDNGVRIRNLANPDKKMSKSDQDPKGNILLDDNPALAAKKVMSATTDSVGVINYDWYNQPGVTNLLQILSLLGGKDQAHINAEWEGRGKYGDLKKAVANQIEQFLSDFQERYQNISDDEVLDKLESSENALRPEANERLLRVQQAVGLRPKVV